MSLRQLGVLQWADHSSQASTSDRSGQTYMRPSSGSVHFLFPAGPDRLMIYGANSLRVRVTTFSRGPAARSARSQRAGMFGLSLAGPR